MLTFIKTGRPYSRPTWSGQNCPRRSKSTITIMANTLTVTTHQVANLGIILTEVESVSVSLIVSNPGPYSSVVLDAEVKVTDQIIIESFFFKRWTILSLKDCKLHDRGFLVAWTPLRATTQEDRLFACFGWFLFVRLLFLFLLVWTPIPAKTQKDRLWKNNIQFSNISRLPVGSSLLRRPKENQCWWWALWEGLSINCLFVLKSWLWSFMKTTQIFPAHYHQHGLIIVLNIIIVIISVFSIISLTVVAIVVICSKDGCLPTK